MSQMQKQYYRALLQKDLEVVNAGGERKRLLLNVAMQLRKCCNHPYLFQGAEPGPPYATGELIIEHAGKRDSRALIFSQYTIEEKVIERTLWRSNRVAVNKDELLQMVIFGAEMVFNSKDSTGTAQ
ncbi:probable chromatin-remodeling complex ATPase chain [Salvia splendens]|uniref:probable chromatin-remodeling complex ATPase chain n=1 Tax=Salvia splendens TaxID=180675 RepID=UPI001C26B20F|nr:probable chromatin-remodeling complex ATPase chain [Salvia splendens]